MEITELRTWHDPRTCTPEQFGGPLAVEITAESDDDLRGLCEEIGAHTLLDLSVVIPDPTWEGIHGFVQLAPDFERGVVAVQSGGHVIELGARPVRPLEVGRAIFDVLSREPLSTTAISPPAEVVHHFCGTSHVMLLMEHLNSDDHPLTGVAARDAAYGEEYGNE